MVASVSPVPGAFKRKRHEIATSDFTHASISPYHCEKYEGMQSLYFSQMAVAESAQTCSGVSPPSGIAPPVPPDAPPAPPTAPAAPPFAPPAEPVDGEEHASPEERITNDNHGLVLRIR
jgi:hypothetical protein